MPVVAPAVIQWQMQFRIMPKPLPVLTVDKLAGFASQFGADFYGLPRNKKEIELINEPYQIANRYPYLDGTITPLMAGQTLNWKLLD